MTQQERENRDAGTPRRSSQQRRDGGFTYVEVVITIVLMGIVVLPILAAVRSSVQAASVSRVAAEVETVLVNAADRVHRADRGTSPTFQCDLSGPAEKAAIVMGGNWSAADVTVEHEYWDTATDQWLSGACPGGTYENGLVQLIRITVSSPDGNVTRNLEVVKGDF